MRLPSLVLIAIFSFTACATTPSDTTMEPPVPTESPLITARPYEFQQPSSLDPKKPIPLIVLLHGFGANGVTQDLIFGFGKLIDRFEFLFAYPDGTVNSKGQHFWNATEVCCDGERTGVDDVAYIDAVIDDMSKKFNVDPQRIYVIGHSNGGFMSHRYACDRASRVAAIMSLAGAAYKDPTKCKPTEAVSILQVHGDMDEQVPYAGAMMGGLAIPSAEETVAGWAMKNGCQAMADRTAPPIDLEANLPGAETQLARYLGCKPGGAAELWTIKDGKHLPIFNRPAWGEAVLGFLYSHAKPQHP